MTTTRALKRARVVIGVQLLVGVAVLTLAVVGSMRAEREVEVAAFGMVAFLGLCQALPAVVGGLLLRHERARTGLMVSGAAGFVPGAMITFLAVTSLRISAILLVGPVGVALMALGFHQLWVRSRLT